MKIKLVKESLNEFLSGTPSDLDDALEGGRYDIEVTSQQMGNAEMLEFLANESSKYGNFQFIGPLDDIIDMYPETGELVRNFMRTPITSKKPLIIEADDQDYQVTQEIYDNNLIVYNFGDSDLLFINVDAVR